jgi:hypothetical protein
MNESNENFIKEADLRDWFKKEKWVDVSRPKKKGKGYEPCGRGDTSKGKKPVCTPANKAKNLTEKERKNRIRQKRKKEKEPNPDKKPNVTKYSPGAGGKSNVSKSYSIKVVTGSKKPHWDDYLSDNDLIGITHDNSREEKNYSYQAEIAADNIYRSGIDFTKELGISYIISALHDKNFSEIPNEKRSKLKYFHSVIVNQLTLQAEKTKNTKQLRMLIFIQENNINIFNYSELLDIAQEYLDESK